MNLFLLACVPLASVAFHRLFQPHRAPFSDPKAWILGGIWSMSALIAASFFGKARVFSGDLLGALVGLGWTDVILGPVAVVAVWLLTRRQRDPWELGLWLALLFTWAGVRDFAATTRSYDLTEYFLVPLARVAVVAALPVMVTRALSAATKVHRVGYWTAASVLAATGALVPVASYAHWGWLVWTLEAAGLAFLAWRGPRFSWATPSEPRQSP